MRSKLGMGITILALTGAGLFSCSIAAAQGAPASLAEQLQAQYKMVKMGSDSNGSTILEEGTLLAVKKGGVLGVPSGSMMACPAKYENGNLKPPGMLCTKGREKGVSSLFSHLPGAVANNASDANKNSSDTRFFKVGDKVYPSSVAVNVKNEKISIQVVSCDSCNKVDPPTYYKSEVDFQFAKGYLETADVSKVEDTIAEVLAIDTDTDAQQDQGGQAAQGQDQAAAPAAAPAPPAEPQNIQLGQTPEQVKATLGPPDKTVDLGAKKIWVYKDLKVTFVKGKVTDVQ
jgi:hypothetical protein